MKNQAKKNPIGEAFAAAHGRRVHNFTVGIEKQPGHSPGNKFGFFNVNHPAVFSVLYVACLGIERGKI